MIYIMTYSIMLWLKDDHWMIRSHHCRMMPFHHFNLIVFVGFFLVDLITSYSKDTFLFIQLHCGWKILPSWFNYVIVEGHSVWFDGTIVERCFFYHVVVKGCFLTGIIMLLLKNAFWSVSLLHSLNVSWSIRPRHCQRMYFG